MAEGGREQPNHQRSQSYPSEFFVTTSYLANLWMVVRNGRVAQGVWVISCEVVEHTLHLVDVREIHANIVMPTPLAVSQPKAAFRIVIGCACAAQVDHRSQVLLLLA